MTGDLYAKVCSTVSINATDILHNLFYSVLNLETSVIALTYITRMANTTNPGNLPHSLAPVFFPSGDPRTHWHGLETRWGRKDMYSSLWKTPPEAVSCLDLVPDGGYRSSAGAGERGRERERARGGEE